MGHDSKCTSLTSPNCAAAISFWKRLYLKYENGHMPCGMRNIQKRVLVGMYVQRVVRSLFRKTYIHENVNKCIQVCVCMCMTLKLKKIGTVVCIALGP